MGVGLSGLEPLTSALSERLGLLLGQPRKRGTALPERQEALRAVASIVGVFEASESRSPPAVHWDNAIRESVRLPTCTTMRVLLVGFSSLRGWDGARRWLATTTPDRDGRGFPIECLSGHRPAAVSLDRGVAAPDA